MFFAFDEIAFETKLRDAYGILNRQFVNARPVHSVPHLYFFFNSKVYADNFHAGDFISTLNFFLLANENERREHQHTRQPNSTQPADAEHAANGRQRKLLVANDLRASICESAGDLYGMTIRPR